MRLLLIQDGVVVGTITGQSASTVALNNPGLLVAEDESGLDQVVGMSYADGVLSGEPMPVEQPAPNIPQAVTMRQARLALLSAGLLSTVDATITAMPGTEGDAARIDWEYAQEVQRSFGLVPAMGQVLGLTDAQLDALFVAAAAL